MTSAATGQTQVAEGNYACRSGDDGSGTNGVTSAASGECDCPAGRYSAGPGNTGCAACNSGYYQSSTEQNNCDTQVSAGNYACLSSEVG